MNSLIKNNKKFFSLILCVLLNGSLNAITIYGQHLSDIATIDQSVTITFPENDDVVMLSMEKGIFEPKSGGIDAIDNLKEVFQRVIDKKDSSCDTKICDMSAFMIFEHSSHIVGKERINLQATTVLNLTDCLLESPSISIVGNEMRFNNCFLINPQILNIVGDSPNSDYQVIQIIFRDQPKNPTVINGNIDLKNNQTPKELLLSNVKAIRVQFNPQAWNK